MPNKHNSISALPTPRQLRYLVTLSETLNFRKAADALFVTQSALSASLKQLESLLGATLVERDKRSVRFTPLGEQIVEHARHLLASTEDLVRIARSAQHPMTGLLRLGVIPTIAPFLLPAILPALRSRYPHLELYLREDVTDRLLDRLNAGELDFALIALPFETDDLKVRELFRDEFRVVVRDDSTLAKLKTVSLQDIDPDRVLLLEEGHCLRNHAIEACGTRRMAKRAVGLEATSLYTLLQMIEGGLGMTLLPEMILKGGALSGSRLVTRPFSTRSPARTIAIVMRRHGARQKDFDLLCELIIEQHRESAQVRTASRHRHSG